MPAVALLLSSGRRQLMGGFIDQEWGPSVTSGEITADREVPLSCMALHALDCAALLGVWWACAVGAARSCTTEYLPRGVVLAPRNGSILAGEIIGVTQVVPPWSAT